MLGEEEKKIAKRNFEAWLEVQERRDELKKENSAIIENTAILFNKKAKIISKVFSILKKKYEDGSDELDEVTSIIEEMKS